MQLELPQTFNDRRSNKTGNLNGIDKIIDARRILFHFRFRSPLCNQNFHINSTEQEMGK